VLSVFLRNGAAGVGAGNTTVRCICARHVPHEPMLQCEGLFCGVWQHVACVRQQLAGSKQQQLLPLEQQHPALVERQQFFCERCRWVDSWRGGGGGMLQDSSQHMQQYVLWNWRLPSPAAVSSTVALCS
jgi:hypothetical protein